MATVSSTSSANQYGLQQLKVQQAQRNADQAAQTASALKAQANEAQRVADRDRENARSLSVQSDQAQTNAAEAQQGLAALRSAQQGINLISNTVDQVLGRQQAQAAAPSAVAAKGAATAAPVPVLNTQGHVTGKIINTTA
jgi:DNA integrity scanning protein DisA with diadenylate cyclase activity